MNKKHKTTHIKRITKEDATVCKNCCIFFVLYLIFRYESKKLYTFFKKTLFMLNVILNFHFYFVFLVGFLFKYCIPHTIFFYILYLLVLFANLQSCYLQVIFYSTMPILLLLALFPTRFLPFYLLLSTL